MDNTAPPQKVLQTMKLRETMASDRELVYTDTGRSSFENLFYEYWSSIYRHVLRLVGDPAEAEDLALEAFLRLYQRRSIPGEEFNVGGWLHRVAVNLGLQSIRSFKRREHYELTAGKDALDSASENRPAEIQADEEARQLTRAVLAHMSPRHSSLLILRHSGMSYSEIAQSLHLSSSSIGPLLLRAEREFEKRYRALNPEGI